MFYPKHHYDIMNKTIMITGIFRSGTTLTGNILGSFKNVEYSFEPPIVFTLDALLKKSEINNDIAIQILRTYLAEDIMVNYHSGRYYNMKPSDDSYILNMKSPEVIKERRENICDTNDSINLINKLDSKLVFKSPSVYFLPQILLENIKDFKIIDIKRDLFSVLGSIVKKEWFSDKNLSSTEYFSNWPYLNSNTKYNIPYFLKEEYIKLWENANEITRSAMVLNSLFSFRQDLFSKTKKSNEKTRIKEIKYEDLVAFPNDIVLEMAQFLNADLTKKTDEQIEKINYVKGKHDISKLLKNCNLKIKNELVENNKKFGYKNIK